MNKPPLLKEFEILWKSLSEKQRIDRINRAYRIYRKVAEKQIESLRNYEKSQAIKNTGFHYFINTLEETWNESDFAVHLGKSKRKKFSYYPVRTILENTLRLQYYINQKKEKQDEIATREMLRITKRFYDHAKASEQDRTAWKTFYNDFARDGNYPQIQHANPKDDPFPNIRELTKMYAHSSWYLFYEALAESSHGKLMAIITKNLDEHSEHRRSLMYLNLLCQKLLNVTDYHMGKIMEKEVQDAIKKAEEIVRKPNHN